MSVVSVTLILFSTQLASAKTIFLSDARDGQTQTYRLLKRFMVERGQGDLLVRQISEEPSDQWKSSRSIMNLFRPGDTLLINMYSETVRYSELGNLLKPLRDKGVRVLIDYEITETFHLWVLDRMPELDEFPAVVSNETVATEIRRRNPAREVFVIPHMEKVYGLLPSEQIERKLRKS